MDAVPSSANGAHNDECRAVIGNGQQSGLRGRGPSVCAVLRSATEKRFCEVQSGQR